MSKISQIHRVCWSRPYFCVFVLQIKSNVIKKRINFNQRPTPVARGSSRATCENSTKRMWRLVSTVSVPSGFSDLILLGVCCQSSVLFRANCHALFSGIKHNAFRRGDSSHLRPLPVARSGCLVPPVVEGWHSETDSSPIEWVRLQKMGPPES